MSNLPPGVTEGMVSGNRPEDCEREAAEEWCSDELFGSDLDSEEIKRAVIIGIAGVKAQRDSLALLIEAAVDDEVEALAMERAAREAGEDSNAKPTR